LAVADYLQRAARHLASKTDVEQAYAVGKAAVVYALAGHNAVMPTVVRKSSRHTRGRSAWRRCRRWRNVEKFMPRDFISADGYGITDPCREYLYPLISGEDYPRTKTGCRDT